ncbi:hypothetical protein FS842_002596, partial [Serendipita sp. 407]
IDVRFTCMSQECHDRSSIDQGSDDQRCAAYGYNGASLELSSRQADHATLDTHATSKSEFSPES